MPIPSGQRDQRLTFQSKAAGQNALGEKTGEWVDAGKIWARAMPVGGREFAALGTTHNATTVRFLMLKPHFAVNEAMRLLWKQRPYSISAIVPPGNEGEMWEVIGTTGVKDGQ